MRKNVQTKIRKFYAHEDYLVNLKNLRMHDLKWTAYVFLGDDLEEAFLNFIYVCKGYVGETINWVNEVESDYRGRKFQVNYNFLEELDAQNEIWIVSETPWLEDSQPWDLFEHHHITGPRVRRRW